MRARAIVALALLVAAPANADPTSQARADALFDDGQKHYQASEFQAAIPLFKQAYDLVHDPVYLFNIAQSYRKSADCENAATYYTQYLAQATDIDAKQRAKVDAWLRELQPCVDQRQKEHEAARRGEALEQAQREQQRARSQPRPVEVDHGRTFRIAGLATAGIGAIGLATGIGFSIRGARIKSELATTCHEPCDWNAPDIAAQNTAGHRANTFAIVSYVGGGLAVIGGAALYLFGRTKVEHVLVTPTAGGATVSARVTF